MNHISELRGWGKTLENYPKFQDWWIDFDFKITWKKDLGCTYLRRYRDHLLGHRKPKTFQCPCCCCYFESKINIGRHPGCLNIKAHSLKKILSFSQYDDGSYFCMICLKSYASKDELIMDDWQLHAPSDLKVIGVSLVSIHL